MAIGTYSDLQAAVAKWMVRTDLAVQIPDFIQLTESRLNRELRVREMISQATGSISTQDLAIPADFVEIYRLRLDTDSDQPLEYRPLEDAEKRWAGLLNGEPKFVTILGDDFRFYPYPDAPYDYTLDYYAKIPALSDANPTNWLLTKAPDVYLFGAVAEGYGYLLDEQREAYWRGKFEAAKRSIGAAEARAKRTSGPRRARVLT